MTHEDINKFLVRCGGPSDYIERAQNREDVEEGTITFEFEDDEPLTIPIKNGVKVLDNGVTVKTYVKYDEEDELKDGSNK